MTIITRSKAPKKAPTKKPVKKAERIGSENMNTFWRALPPLAFQCKFPYGLRRYSLQRYVSVSRRLQKATIHLAN